MLNMFKRRDLFLDLYVVSMGIFGLFCVGSVSNYFFSFQGIFFILALFTYIFLSSISEKILTVFLFVLYFINLGGLIYLFLFGTVTRGSTSWINFGVINYQPSEFAKISIVFLAARILSSFNFLNKKILFFVISVLPVLILIFLQPDFGNFFVLIFSISFIFFIGFLNVKRMILVLLFFGIVSTCLYYVVLKPYQRLRIDSFIFQNNVNTPSNYNLNQSKIAIGSGGVLGRGFDNTQVKLNFLPESHTDFIFSAISEKYGFIFSMFTVFMFLGLCLWVFYKYILKARSAYFLYLACGIFAIFMIQVILNLGMTVGLLPITGLTLPFVSYGGSSLLTFFVLFSLLQRTNLR